MTEAQLHEITSQVAHLIYKRDEVLSKTAILIDSHQLDPQMFLEFIKIMQSIDNALTELTHKVKSSGISYEQFMSVLVPMIHDKQLDMAEAVNKIAC